MNQIDKSIKLNQAMVENWMLYQAVEDILELYVSMSKGTFPEVLQKQIEPIYLTHDENDQEVCHFFQHLENACLEMLKSVCLHFFLLLQFFGVLAGKGVSIIFSFSGSTLLPDKNVPAFQ